MGVHWPPLRAPYHTVRPIPLYHGTGGTVHGSPLSHLRAPYPTVRPIPLYHGTGGTVHGSPLSLLKGPISHCPSYPTVPWDRWDCPWESTVPPKGPHIPLSVLSHCTMGQVGLSMGVHWPPLRAPYHTVRPIPLYHGTGGTVHGSPLSHLRAPYPTVRPIPLYHGTGGTVHGSPLSHLRAPYPTVRPIPLYHGTGGTVHGIPLSHLRAPISHCPSYPTVPWDNFQL